MGDDGTSGTIRSRPDLWSILVMYVGGIAVFAWTALRYVNQEYVLTNRRVIQVEGVLNRSATDSSLEKINDAVLSQSIFGRMFDFGDLRVLTAAEAGIESFRMIRGPDHVQEEDARREARVRARHGARRPAAAPPIRQTPVADAAPQAAAGGEAGAAGAGVATAAADDLDETKAVNTELSPDEVTRTLNNLADLRDRGAITAAEYEAKKADLLSRL